MLKVTGKRASSEFTGEDVSKLNADLESRLEGMSDAAEPDGDIPIDFNAEEFAQAASQ